MCNRINFDNLRLQEMEGSEKANKENGFSFHVMAILTQYRVKSLLRKKKLDII